MSGTHVDGQGPIVDVDFNGVNLDTDIDVNSVHGESSITKEYTVDVDAGTFNLNIEFKNDVGDNGDRNFYVDSIEVANDGTSYEPWFITTSNSNLETPVNFMQIGYWPQLDGDDNPVLNSAYDSTQPLSDDDAWFDESNHLAHPGNNAKRLYEAKTGPITLYTNQVASLSITFS